MTPLIGRSVATAFGAALLAMMLLPRAASAEETGSRVVDGLAIYLGLMPAEIVRSHPRAHPERTMHGDVSKDEHAYHLVVAVFDERTGARLENLEVKATIHPPARPPSTVRLDKMAIEGTVTYGSYFDLAGYGPYRISLRILRPGESKPVVADFTYEHLVK